MKDKHYKFKTGYYAQSELKDKFGLSRSQRRQLKPDCFLPNPVNSASPPMPLYNEATVLEWIEVNRNLVERNRLQREKAALKERQKSAIGPYLCAWEQHRPQACRLIQQLVFSVDITCAESETVTMAAEQGVEVLGASFLSCMQEKEDLRLAVCQHSNLEEIQSKIAELSDMSMAVYQDLAMLVGASQLAKVSNTDVVFALQPDSKFKEMFCLTLPDFKLIPPEADSISLSDMNNLMMNSIRYYAEA